MKRAEILLNLVIGICGSLIASLIYSRLQKIHWKRTARAFIKTAKQAINDVKVNSILASYSIKGSIHSFRYSIHKQELVTRTLALISFLMMMFFFVYMARQRNTTVALDMDPYLELYKRDSYRPTKVEAIKTNDGRIHYLYNEGEY